MISDADQFYIQNYFQELVHRYHKTAEHQVYSDPTAFAEFQLECNKVRAGIPVKFRPATIQSIADPAFAEQLQDYLVNFEKYLSKGIAPLLTGPNGTGKTLAGCIILIEAIKKGHTAYFTKVKNCIDQITSGFSDEEDKQKFKDQLLLVDFLMIDDLGDELQTTLPSSNLRVFTVNHILRDRADNCRPTILTTNLKMDQLNTNYGPKSRSIIDEFARVITTRGPDYRQVAISTQINPK